MKEIKCMKYNTKWYWEKSPQQKIIVPTFIIVHLCFNVMTVTEVKDAKSVCNKNQSHKAIQRHPIFLTDSYHDFILDEIKSRETIEYDRKNEC